MTVLNRWVTHGVISCLALCVVIVGMETVVIEQYWRPQQQAQLHQQRTQQLRLTAALFDQWHQRAGRELGQLATTTALNWASPPPTVPPPIETALQQVLAAAPEYQELQWIDVRGDIRLRTRRESERLVTQNANLGRVDTTLLTRLPPATPMAVLVAEVNRPLQWFRPLVGDAGQLLGWLHLQLALDEVLGDAAPHITREDGTPLTPWPGAAPGPVMATEVIPPDNTSPWVGLRWIADDKTTLVLWDQAALVALPSWFWLLLAVVALIGSGAVAWRLGQPWQRLAHDAEQLSLGQQLEKPLTPQGAAEVQQLAMALNRLRLSVKKAIQRSDRQRA